MWHTINSNRGNHVGDRWCAAAGDGTGVEWEQTLWQGRCKWEWQIQTPYTTICILPHVTCRHCDTELVIMTNTTNVEVWGFFGYLVLLGSVLCRLAQLLLLHTSFALIHSCLSACPAYLLLPFIPYFHSNQKPTNKHLTQHTCICTNIVTATRLPRDVALVAKSQSWSHLEQKTECLGPGPQCLVLQAHFQR